MPFEQFLDLTPREFFEALWEKEKHEETLIKYQVRFICETIRMQTALLLNYPQGAKIRDPKKLIRFMWEGPSIKPTQTKEEMKEVAKAIAAGWAKIKT